MQEVWLHKFQEIHICGQKNAHQPVFPYKIIENSPTPLIVLITLFSLVQMASNLAERNAIWLNRPYQNLRQIGHNFRNHIFDDFI